MFGDVSNELRQRLINLLYLVFITLAFIYLPSDFLDSSKYLKRSLEQTAEEYEKNIDSKRGLLDEQLYLNTPMAQDYYNVMDVANTIDTALGHINRLAEGVEQAVGGYSPENYLQRSKNFLISGKLLLNSGNITVLKEQIENIRVKMNSYNLDGIVPQLDSVLPSNLVLKGSNGKDRSWENFFFAKTPVIVSITNLYKIKTDLLYAKYKLVEYLVSNLNNNKTSKNISILSSNSLAVEVLAAKNYTLGDRVTFRIILLDSARNQGGFSKIKSYVKKGNRVIKEYGVDQNGIVTFTANQVGKYEFVVVDSTNTIAQDFVINNLRTLYTEKTEPEVLYLGIDNPIQIQSTGFNIEDLVLEISSGEIIPFKGNYYLRFSSEGLATLKVYATNPDGRFLVREKAYMVKKLPNPVVSLDGNTGGNISYKILQIQDELVVASEEVNVEDVYNILSFELVKVTNRGKESVINRSKKFSHDARKMLRDMKNSDLLVIDNIKVKATDGTLKEVAPVVYSVK